MSDERGVSEVLGYVLVIGVVTATIAVVMTVGVGGLEAAQEAERTNNMERAFDVLAENFETIYVGEAPSRATEIRLLDGELGYTDPAELSVTIDGDPIDNLSVESHPIAYNDGAGTVIAYEAGSIIRAQDNHSVMLREPSFIVEEDEAVLPLVRTRPESGSLDRIGGHGTILIIAEALDTTVATEEWSVDNKTVEVTVRTDHPKAWAQYFDGLDHPDGAVEEASDEVTYQYTTDEHTITVVVQRLRLTISP